MTPRTAPRRGEVHLWTASLDGAPDELVAAASGEERRRADRFARPDDSRRHLAARGWLRHLLGTYLGAPPAGVPIVLDERGKPGIGREQWAWLQFNLAHCGDRLMVAVARGCRVGVDIERIRDDVDVDGLASRFLTRSQHAALARLSGACRIAAFFDAWTRNEALLKGIGSGLDGAERDLDAPPGWSVSAVAAGDGFAAAVAVEHARARLPREAWPIDA